MKLRGYPLISHNGTPSWPPAWWWTGPGNNRYPRGEVGILKQVLPCSIKAADRCYLIMEHEGAEYLGILVFQDYAVCQQVYSLLLRYCGRPIQEIGEIDHAL